MNKPVSVPTVFFLSFVLFFLSFPSSLDSRKVGLILLQKDKIMASEEKEERGKLTTGGEQHEIRPDGQNLGAEGESITVLYVCECMFVK